MTEYFHGSVQLSGRKDQIKSTTAPNATRQPNPDAVSDDFVFDETGGFRSLELYTQPQTSHFGGSPVNHRIVLQFPQDRFTSANLYV